MSASNKKDRLAATVAKAAEVAAKPNPYIEQRPDGPVDIREPQLLVNQRFAEFYIDKNDRTHQTPAKLAIWIREQSQKAKDAGWGSLHVEIGHSYDEFDRPLSDYIWLKGDIFETKSQAARRVEQTVAKWKRDRQADLFQQRFWESELGLARRQEIS